MNKLSVTLLRGAVAGVALLPSLFQALKNRPHRHTFLFIAFAAEERGLVGSTKYVKSLTAGERAADRAFVNLECLGMASLKVWTHRAAPELVARLNDVAVAMHLPLQSVNVEKVGDDDSHPFLSPGFR